eukprot:12908915-Prorocentrum_lima.AAC.1
MIKRCGRRLATVVKRQMGRVAPEDAPRYQRLEILLTTIDQNPAVAQSADWVGTLGGARTGVYFLYGHPT